MCEAYALTGSPLFKDSAQAGVDYIKMSRHPDLAWRSLVRPDDDDATVTFWLLAALTSA